MHPNSLLTPRNSYAKRGFTLVELLVVIAIIATLASLSMGGFQVVQENARKTIAKKTCVDLVNAVQLFENDYGVLPTVPNATAVGTGGDMQSLSDNNLMNILLAKDTTAAALNSRQTRYLNLEIASSPVLASATKGLHETAADAHLLDPWNTLANGGYYVVILDTDYNNEIASPFSDAAPQDFIRGKKVIAYSNGNDGVIETAKGYKGGDNKDNVYSWAK